MGPAATRPKLFFAAFCKHFEECGKAESAALTSI